MQKPKLASEMMVTKLYTVRPEQDILSAIRMMLSRCISGSPVVDQRGKYRGIFSEKCCMNVLAMMERSAMEAGRAERISQVKARDIMQTRLITLRPNMDVFDAIGYLIQRKISGAPVLDEQGDYLGVFSEKGSMDVVIESAYSQLPTTRVGYFMDLDRGRVIDEQTDLMTITRIFLDTPYRRLTVLRGNHLVGMISRRDVLACQLRLSEDFWRLPRNPKQTEELNETVVLHGTDMRTTPPLVSEFMDTDAETITQEHDMLSIAQLFRDLPYRRLPVLCGDDLKGQISRRDLLAVAHRSLAMKPPVEQNLLYLSSLVERSEAPVARLI
jgi:CBS domain-containing protein